MILKRIGLELKFKSGGESWRLIDKNEAPIILEEWLSNEIRYLSVNGDIIKKEELHVVSFRNKYVQ